MQNQCLSPVLLQRVADPSLSTHWKLYASADDPPRISDHLNPAACAGVAAMTISNTAANHRIICDLLFLFPFLPAAVHMDAAASSPSMDFLANPSNLRGNP